MSTSTLGEQAAAKAMELLRGVPKSKRIESYP